MSATPNPGSPEAVAQGCSCAVLDNHHGAGVPWPRPDGKDPYENPSFWISGSCALHGVDVMRDAFLEAVG